VAEFLSPDWIAQLDAAVRAADLSDDLGELTVEQVVRDEQLGEVRYSLRVDSGGARIVTGPAGSVDVRFITDYDTAVGLHRGDLNVQEAIARGRCRLEGPLQRVRGREAALRALDDVFASVRKSTTYR
jgi:SCP-2 sterol transfer family